MTNGTETAQESSAVIDILLVEDNEADIQLMVEILKEGKIPNDFHVVTDGEAAAGPFHQGINKRHVLPVPRMGCIQTDRKSFLPRQFAFIAENVLGQNPQRVAQHGWQKWNGYLARAGTANHIVVDNLTFTDQTNMIIHEILRFDHIQSQII